MQEQLDNLLKEMDGLSIQVNSSESVIEILKNIPKGEENYFDRYPRIRDSFRAILFSFTAQRPLRGRISVFSKYFDYVDLSNRVDSQNVTKDYIQNNSKISKAIASDAYKIFLTPHIDEWSSNGEMVISVLRPLRDNYNVYGLVEVSYSLLELEKICSFEESATPIHAALFDENKHLIYDNFSPNFKQNKNALYSEKISEGPSGSYIIKNNTNKINLIATFAKLNNVNWTLVLFEDMNYFRKPINYLSNAITLTYFMVFIIILLTLYFFTSSITKPIRQLKDSISQVDMDSLKIVLSDNHTNNEITLLGNAFQDLLDEARTAMHKMIESRSREMKAYFTVLQSQLNPHFLYNTLTVIGAYGQKKGNPEVAEMCSILSDMLRYTVKTDEKYTTLEFELKHVENYLHLMSKRFESFLEYQISCDFLLNQIDVPKLILQPLVENAFQHAFTNQEPPWKIGVKGYLKNDYWYISIQDNGKGFDPASLKVIGEKLTEAKRNLSSGQYFNESPQNGLGLMNTFLRLMIFYDGTEFIDLYNNPDGGATILIGGPTKQQ